MSTKIHSEIYPKWTKKSVSDKVYNFPERDFDLAYRTWKANNDEDARQFVMDELYRLCGVVVFKYKNFSYDGAQADLFIKCVDEMEQWDSSHRAYSFFFSIAQNFLFTKKRDNKNEYNMQNKFLNYYIMGDYYYEGISSCRDDMDLRYNLLMAKDVVGSVHALEMSMFFRNNIGGDYLMDIDNHFVSWASTAQKKILSDKTYREIGYIWKININCLITRRDIQMVIRRKFSDGGANRVHSCIKVFCPCCNRLITLDKNDVISDGMDVDIANIEEYVEPTQTELMLFDEEVASWYNEENIIFMNHGVNITGKRGRPKKINMELLEIGDKEEIEEIEIEEEAVDRVDRDETERQEKNDK